ncbi:MAG: YlxR family protein [Anaerolineae bacterium]|nr:YlxR family protein [Anaerolineae bacterium]
MARQVAQPQRRRHVPQRSCVVCRTTADKRSLTRLVRTPDEGVQIDLTGKRSGRGAYLCDQATCWDRALAGEALAQALRTTLTDADRERIRAARPPEQS